MAPSSWQFDGTFALCILLEDRWKGCSGVPRWKLPRVFHEHSFTRAAIHTQRIVGIRDPGARTWCKRRGGYVGDGKGKMGTCMRGTWMSHPSGERRSWRSASAMGSAHEGRGCRTLHEWSYGGTYHFFTVSALAGHENRWRLPGYDTHSQPLSTAFV
jgi:hypothetical protein